MITGIEFVADDIGDDPTVLSGKLMIKYEIPVIKFECVITSNGVEFKDVVTNKPRRLYRKLRLPVYKNASMPTYSGHIGTEIN